MWPADYHPLPPPLIHRAPHSTYYWLASLIVTVQLQLETLRNGLEITWVSPDIAVTQRLDIRDYPTVIWCCLAFVVQIKYLTCVCCLHSTMGWSLWVLRTRFQWTAHTLCSLPAPFDHLSFTLHNYFFNFSTNKVIRKSLPPTIYTSLVFFAHGRLFINLSITKTLLCYYNIDQLNCL